MLYTQREQMEQWLRKCLEKYCTKKIILYTKKEKRNIKSGEKTKQKSDSNLNLRVCWGLVEILRPTKNDFPSTFWARRKVRIAQPVATVTPTDGKRTQSPLTPIWLLPSLLGKIVLEIIDKSFVILEMKFDIRQERGKEELAASIELLLPYTDEWHFKALEKPGSMEKKCLNLWRIGVISDDWRITSNAHFFPKGGKQILESTDQKTSILLIIFLKFCNS